MRLRQAGRHGRRAQPRRRAAAAALVIVRLAAGVIGLSAWVASVAAGPAWAAPAAATPASVIASAPVAASSVSASPASPAPTESTPAADPSAGPAYRIGTPLSADGVNPFRARSSLSWEVLRLGYSFLTGYDADYRPAPDLARSWELADDGLTWTFHLHPGMSWHDGMPLTSGDVVFTWRLVHELRCEPFARELAGVLDVQAPDPTTVVVTTRRPHAVVPGGGVPILPEHIWAGVGPGELANGSNLPFVGSGPFRIAAVGDDGEITLAANPAYPRDLGGPPSVRRLIFKGGRSTASLLVDYAAGRLDAVLAMPVALRPELAARRGSATVAAPALGFRGLGFNCWSSPASKGDPLLRDASIRRAVHWAIDVDALAAAVLGDATGSGTSVLSPAYGAWRWQPPEASPAGHDPQHAKRILDDAGYQDADGDGVREDAGGRRLAFRLAVVTGEGDHRGADDGGAGKEDLTEGERAAAMLARWCRDVGIELRPRAMSAAEFAERVGDDADYDMVLRRWSGGVDPGSILGAFVTRQRPTTEWLGYSAPLYDRVYAAQAQSVAPGDLNDSVARGKQITALQKLVYRDDPVVVLWYDRNLQAYRRDRWSGYAPAPGRGGAPFQNHLRDTYVALHPARALDPTTDPAAVRLWGLVAGAIAAAAVGLAVFRRQRPPSGDAR